MMASPRPPQVTWREVREGDAVTLVAACVTPASDSDCAKRDFEIRPGWRDSLGEAFAGKRNTNQCDLLAALAAGVTQDEGGMTARAIAFWRSFPDEAGDWGDAAFAAWMTKDFSSKDHGVACRDLFVGLLRACAFSEVTHSVAEGEVVVKYKLDHPEGSMKGLVTLKLESVDGLKEMVSSVTEAAEESKGGADGGGAGVDSAEDSAGAQFISFGGGVSSGAEVLDSELTAALHPNCLNVCVFLPLAGGEQCGSEHLAWCAPVSWEC